MLFLCNDWPFLSGFFKQLYFTLAVLFMYRSCDSLEIPKSKDYFLSLILEYLNFFLQLLLLPHCLSYFYEARIKRMLDFLIRASVSSNLSVIIYFITLFFCALFWIISFDLYSSLILSSGMSNLFFSRLTEYFLFIMSPL